MREAVLELRLHRLFLIPHLAVDADVPVFVHDDVVITLVQHAQALQACRLCGHREQLYSLPALQMFTVPTENLKHKNALWLKEVKLSISYFIFHSRLLCVYNMCLNGFIIEMYVLEVDNHTEKYGRFQLKFI